MNAHLSFPHTYQSITVRGVYGRLLLAVAPLVFIAIRRGGVTSIMVFVVAIASGAVAEFVLDLVRTGDSRQSTTRNGRVLFFMLLLSLLLPVRTPPIVVAIAAAVTVVVGIHLMGNAGVYYVHPVCIGLLVASVAGITTMPDIASEPAVSTTAMIANAGWYHFVSEYAFVPLGMRVPPESIALLVTLNDGGAVSIGAGLLLPLLLGGIIVFGEDLAPAVMVWAFIAAAVSVFFITGADIIRFFINSNLLLVIVFFSAEPSVRPVSRGGMILFGALTGGLSALLLSLGTVIMPVAAAIALGATLLPLFDYLEVRR